MTEGDAVNLSEVKNGLVRIAIAYTGQKYKQGDKEFTISLSDLHSMAANMSQRETPIDYEHLSAQQVPPGWSKAAGWIKPQDPQIEKLSDGRSLLWGWFEPTPACLSAIHQKEYRYFSPEIHWNDTDEKGKNIGTRLRAGAVTNRPFLKDLPPIEVSATDYPQLLEAVALSESKRLLIDAGDVHVTGVINRDKEKKTMKTLSFKKLSEGEHKGKKGIFDGDEMVGLADEASMKSCLAEDDPTDKDADDLEARKLTEIRTAEAACFTEFAKAKPGETLTLAEKFVSEGKLTMPGYLRVQKIERLVDGAIAKGKILPKQRPAIFSMAVADYDSAVAFLNEAKAVVDLRVHGIEGSGEIPTAKEEMQKRTTAYMTEHKDKTYADAMRAVTAQDPQFYERYKQECSIAAGDPAQR